MKGIIYEVTYTESLMDAMHGGYYTTRVIHIPELHCEINKQRIRKENDKYDHCNGVPIIKVREINLPNEYKLPIQKILKASEVEPSLIKEFERFMEMPKCKTCDGKHMVGNGQDIPYSKCNACHGTGHSMLRDQKLVPHI